MCFVLLWESRLSFEVTKPLVPMCISECVLPPPHQRDVTSPGWVRLHHQFIHLFRVRLEVGQGCVTYHPMQTIPAQIFESAPPHLHENDTCMSYNLYFILTKKAKNSIQILCRTLTSSVGLRTVFISGVFVGL